MLQRCDRNGGRRKLWMIGHLTIDDLVWWDGRTKMRSVGGAALYAAIGACSVGVTSTVISRRGRDFPAASLALFEELGVDILLAEADASCISEWILYESDGSRELLLHPGSGSRDELSPRAEEFDSPHDGAVHIAPLPVHHQYAWCRATSEAGNVITLDPLDGSCAESPEEVLALVPMVDAFLPSKLEADLLVGGDAVREVRAFREMGAPVAAVKMGAAGSVVAFGDEVWHVPALPVQAQDPTGAGDAFCGGFAAALALGWDALTAACWGTAAAAVVVETVGTQVDAKSLAPEGIPPRVAEVMPRLISGNGTEPSQVSPPDGRGGAVSEIAKGEAS